VLTVTSLVNGINCSENEITAYMEFELLLLIVVSPLFYDCR
jgi:hypothetical protein